MFRIITIIKKELYDLVRDRRTMFFMAIFPAVIIPLLIGGVAQLSIFFAKKEMDKTLNIAIVDEQYLPGLVNIFKGLGTINVETNLSEKSIKGQILEEQLDAGIIIIPNNTQEKFELKFYFRSEKGVNISERRLEEILKMSFLQVFSRETSA